VAAVDEEKNATGVEESPTRGHKVVVEQAPIVVRRSPTVPATRDGPYASLVILIVIIIIEDEELHRLPIILNSLLLFTPSLLYLSNSQFNSIQNSIKNPKRTMFKKKDLSPRVVESNQIPILILISI